MDIANIFSNIIAARTTTTARPKMTTESTIAPGDEDQLCRELRTSEEAPIPTYSANMRVLMDSWNYQNLLPPRPGAVWDQVDNDMNNRPESTTSVCCAKQLIAVACILYIINHCYAVDSEFKC